MAMIGVGQQSAAASQLQEGDAFLRRTACNAKEVASVALGEAAVPFRDVGGDGQGGAVKLIDEESVTARERLGVGTDGVGEVDGFLVDEELFEREGHGQAP